MNKLICVFLGVAAYAQMPRPVATPELAGANLPAQKIGVNDLVSVSVYGSPELTGTSRVGADGTIRMPMLKRHIPAEGRMPSEMETAIAEALKAEQILVDPFVTVTLAEYYSRPISVAGAVKNPVTFQAIGSVTLLDAITRAGGLSPDAGPDILVSRMQPGEEGKPVALTQRIPVKALLDAADPELNLKLAGGEEIRVPEVGKIFVVGNVKKPGVFPVQDIADTTVLKVLALAEGIAPYAAKHAYIYRRVDGAATKNEIPIEVEKILARKSPDVPLQANDILYIPDAKGRRAGMQALERILGFGSATASGMLVWGSR